MSVAVVAQFGQGVSAAMVGRTTELQVLVTAVSAPPAVAVVEGEAGIGKSRLIDELQRTEPEGVRHVAIGRCRQIPEPFPLGPLVSAVQRLAPHLQQVALSPVTGALRPLVPDLAEVLPEQPDALDDRAAERHRTFRGLAALLAACGPTLLVIEDLQWADDQTVEFLGYLLADPPPQLAVVITFRTEDVDHQFRAVTATRAPHVRRTDLVLEPLNVADTGTLAAAILELDRVSPSFARYLRERSSGVPFAIEELLALMRSRGVLVRRGGSWARRALAELDVPTSIRDSVLERVSQQPSEVRTVLNAVAVLATPATVPFIGSVADMAEGAVLTAVEDAMGAGILTGQDDAIFFRHVLSAQAVYEAIDETARERLHGRAASALRSTTAPPLGQVAHHLQRADNDPRWIDAAEEAAGAAMARGYEAEAVRLLENILRKVPDDQINDEQRSRIAVKLAQAAAETMQDTEGVVDLLLALVEKVEPAHRGELRFWLAALFEHTGRDPRQERQLLIDAVGELDHQPRLKAWAMMALGMPIVPGDTRDERLGWLQRALNVLPEVNDPSFAVFLRGKVAMVLLGLGEPEWRRLVEQMKAASDTAPKSRQEANAYHSVGLEAVYAGHHDVADDLLTTSLEAAAANDSRRLELQVRASIALLDFSRGTWTELEPTLEPLLDGLVEYAPGRADLEVTAGCLAMARNDVGRATSELLRVAEGLYRRGRHDVLALPVAALAHAAPETDRGREILDLVRRYFAAIEPLGAWAVGIRALPAAVRLLVDTGDLGGAERLADGCARESSTLDAPYAIAALPHARGLLSIGQDDPASAAKLLLEAADAYETLDAAYDAAHARESAGEALAASGRAAPAAAEFHTALETYQKLGAHRDAARLTATTRRQDVPLPVAHRGGRRGYGNELSPREREVAVLVARGAPNKEIATQLHLAVSTVEKHLSSAMRKLGVSSRTGIVHHLNQEPDQT